MNPQAQTLYKRVQAYSLDSEGANFSFSQRLAKENGWTEAYSQRVMDEYKKFVLLAMVADHIVSPSDQVDQAWHLHLTYTHSYWDELCKDILGKPLHHEPSRGGLTEKQKFWQLYQQTLNSYQRLFNEMPPAEIWPSPEQRFGYDLNCVRVNTQRYWLIPKPIWSWPTQTWQQVRVITLLLLVPAVISGCAAVSSLLITSMSIGELFWLDDLMNLSASNFLWFYAGTGLSLLLIISALYESELGAKQTVDPDYPTGSVILSTEQLAYLAGGPDRVLHSALIALIEQGSLQIGVDKKSLEIVGSCQFPSKVEQAIIDTVNNGRHEIKELLAAVKCSTTSIRDSLVAQKLWAVSDAQHKVGLLLMPLILLGLARLVHGLSAGHPVGYLMALLVVTIAIPLMFGLDKRTAYGDQVLGGYKKEKPDSNTEQTLCFAVAIEGLSILANTALAETGQSLSVGSGETGGDAGCGGGGCGGCGGCGG